MDSFEKFIVENGNADTVRLVMACKEWPVPEDAELAELDAKSLAVNTIEGRRRLRKKLPEWVACTGLVYPSSLCAEQCSSSDTARYKASIVQRIFNEYVGTVASMVGDPCRTTGSATKGTESVPDKNSPTTRNQSVTEPAEVTIGTRKTGRIADLTGGLGVDSWAFSEVAEEVLYNEMNPALAAAARHNFKALGVTNIFIKNSEATSDSLKDIFGDFRPDVIFLDPARRDSAGKKVFLLEDCSPDVLKILPELFGISRFVLLKLSPMADITMAVERLDRTYEEYLEKASGKGWNGQWVREVHVVASGGECKELLILLDGEWNEGYSLTCREDGKTLTFKPEEITKAKAGYPDSTFARIIFEPGKSLTKAGVSNAICERFGLVKLARFTHLYTISEPLSDSESEQRTAPLKDFGKVFYVKEILPLNKSSMKDVGKRYPHSEVSAKNIPMSSDELRTRLKVKSGDDAHIFGVRIETPYNEDNYLIVTEPSGH
uniref:THUMP-like domain-containing protein n=1 Tax=Candidatus Cryptobacteroides bacterium TaxID=3085639 RepID=UPI00402930AF